MLMSRPAPFSLRIPADLRIELEGFAEKNGLKLHPLCLMLLREGLYAHTSVATKDRAGVELARGDPGAPLVPARVPPEEEA